MKLKPLQFTIESNGVAWAECILGTIFIRPIPNGTPRPNWSIWLKNAGYDQERAFLKDTPELNDRELLMEYAQKRYAEVILSCFEVT